MVVDITAEEAASGEDSTKNGEEAMQEDDNILMEEHQANKRVKMGVNGVNGVNGKSPNSVSSKSSSKAGAKHVEPVCEICSQRLNDQDLRLYPGHPNNSVDEYSVLLDPKLCLFNGDEVDITEGDARALNKITSFRYDCVFFFFKFYSFRITSTSVCLPNKVTVMLKTKTIQFFSKIKCFMSVKDALSTNLF